MKLEEYIAIMMQDVEYRMWHELINAHGYVKATRIVAARKLARRKERNLALAKGKHGMKRPK